MLAARDQENLVHGHQAAAASKPLNLGTRQLAPKTPANRPLKTPFKLPLNDENSAKTFGGGKVGPNTTGRGNENIIMTGKKSGLGDKNAFVTPMGPRTRAPLGAKTTNAKAKAFQTPLPTLLSHDPDKQPQKSATARKAKPRVSHAEMTKLEILGDNDVLNSKDDADEPEIEYMPPPVKNLPDIPDDIPDLDLSIFDNDGLTRGYMSHFLNKPDAEGLSYYDRKDQEEQKRSEYLDKMYEAMSIRAFDSADIPCVHYPECAGEDCKDMPAIRRKAEEKFQETMAELDRKVPAPKTDSTTKVPKATIAARAPSSTLSKHAATALSQSRPSATTKATIKPNAAPKARLPSSLLPSSRKTPHAPTNPSPMRHTAASAASKQTMGYSKGRATSATLRKTVLPSTHLMRAPPHGSAKPKAAPATQQSDEPDTSLSPGLYIQRYGVPRVGSEMWNLCARSGCFDDDDEEEIREREEGRLRLEAMWREEAEEEFVLGV